MSGIHVVQLANQSVFNRLVDMGTVVWKNVSAKATEILFIFQGSNVINIS